MNRHWRKGLILIAALSPAVSTFVGCGGDDQNGQPGTTDGGSHDATTADVVTHDGGADTGTDSATDGSTDGATDGGTSVTVQGVTAPDDQWTWVPIPGAVCGNNSATGIGVNPHSDSTTLTIYFEGGGACWNDVNCQAVPGETTSAQASFLGGFDNTEFQDGGAVASYGLFQRTGNPLATENFVYVPYCTGDIHAGNNVATYANLALDAGVGATFQIHHVGYTNAGLDVAAIKAAFPNLTRLIVTGSSAGGYGALFNYERIHQAFPNVQTFLIDDSGPPLAAPSEFAAQNAKWNNFANLPSDCQGCSPGDGGTFENIFPYLTAQDPKFKGSLLETDHDMVISAFFSNSPLFGGPENNGGGPEGQSGCVDDDGGIGPGPCDFTTALGTVYTGLATANVADGGQLRAFIEHDTFHTYLGARYPLVSPFIASQLGLDGGADGGWTDNTPYPHP